MRYRRSARKLLTRAAGTIVALSGAVALPQAVVDSGVDFRRVSAPAEASR